MFWDFPRSRPKAVKGGIKAQSQYGRIGRTWWAQRWIAVLESFNLGARLSRGRSYARKGQVTKINIGDDGVTASVQGSSAKPYNVTIKVKKLTSGEWDRVIAQLNHQAIYVATLLSGEMPQEIEAVFTEAGVSLFPKHVNDLTTSCSCPDYSNPCKHIAAVYYLLGEEFDRDPFLLLKLRGLDRASLLAQLTSQPAPGEATPPVQGEPLATNPDQFWGTPLAPDVVGPLSEPPIVAGVLRRLGKFPFWRGDVPLLETLTPCYIAARDVGARAYLGER